MRITHVVRQFPPAIGGLEEVVLQLTQRLNALPGFEVDVVTLNRVFSDANTELPETDMAGDVPVTRIPFYGSRRYPIAPSVLKHIRNCDVVHVHGIDFFFDALAATRLMHRKPLVATTHGGFFHTSFASSLKQIYFNTATRLSCLAYREIFATSHNDKRLFDTIAPGKVRVVENGVDVGKWRERGSKVLRPRLIYFGRLSSNKRIPALLDILRELRASGTDWTLCIAGRPDDVSFETLRGHAERLNVQSSVSFVASPSSDQIAELLDECSFYISASEHEGFGISAVEAMSAGLYPVLSNIPAFQHFTADGLGLLIDPLKPKECAAAIGSLYAQSGNHDVTARERRLRFAAQYNWDAVAQDIAASYRRLFKQQPV